MWTSALLSIGCTLLLAALPGFAALATAAATAQPTQSPAAVAPVAAGTDLEAFVRDGCPSCAEAEEFLARLHRERPGLAMAIRDVGRDPAALARLRQIGEGRRDVRVPAFRVGDQFIIGYSAAAGTDRAIRAALDRAGVDAPAPAAGTCTADASLSCDGAPAVGGAPGVALSVLGRTIALDTVGLPLFTVAIGLLDGFNPCSMWVLLLMLSLLATLGSRRRMLAIAGTFVAVQGLAYYAFMAAWLNAFLLLGLSRASEIVIGVVAIVAGAINIKDFAAFGRGVSLSIPESAKPGIYARIRGLLVADRSGAALAGAALLALLVQVVELLCTSGFPALYTRILTLRELDGAAYYGYLLLYNLAYMLDDVVVLGIGVATLSHHRLQEREGRWLKLAAGLTMMGLGGYLVA